MNISPVKNKASWPVFVVTAFVALDLAFCANLVFGANLNSSVTVTSTAPAMGTVTVNGGSNITLSPGTTVSIPVTAQVNDYNGCADFNSGTTTVLLYASTISSSTCNAGGSPGNTYTCYVATSFSTSSCSGSLANTTTTFNIQYFAKATDGSSSVPSANWKATVTFRAPSGATTTADSASSTTPDVLTLLAFNLSTSTITYGNVPASQNTGATNQTTSIQNYGNSTDGSFIYGTNFVSGATTFATTSQLYATTSFNAGSAGVPLTDVQTTQITGFQLNAATSTSINSSTIFWGLSVPGGTPTGTYNATNTLTALFVSS